MAILGSKGSVIHCHIQMKNNCKHFDFTLTGLSCLLLIGSGKKALLDVIGCRAYGPRKGYILLNGVTVNRRLFHSAGSYLNGMGDACLQPGLTVYQTLHYEACLTLNIPSAVRKLRIKQILSDVALSKYLDEMLLLSYFT